MACPPTGGTEAADTGANISHSEHDTSGETSGSVNEEPDRTLDEVQSLNRLGGSRYEENAILKALHSDNDNILNRLLSIEHDTSRTLSLCEELLSGTNHDLPIFGNARAGSWYTPPSLIADGTERQTYGCSFKSNDGHYGRWNSSVRRPNLHVLDQLAKHGTVIVVDATRSGKRVPDSLSKTLPIWCAVLSHLLTGSAHEVHVHPSISANESAAIDALLPTFAAQWAARGMSAHPSIRRARDAGIRAMRCLWLRPGALTWDGGVVPLGDLDFAPVLCVSASDAVQHGERSLVENVADTFTALGHSFPPRGTFAYVQGAGDDEENWAQGLSAPLFWAHRDELLRDVHKDRDRDILHRAVQSVVGRRVVDHSVESIVIPIWSSGLAILPPGSTAAFDQFLRANKDVSHRFSLIVALGFPAVDPEASKKEEEKGSTSNAEDDMATVLRVPLTDYKGKVEYKYAFGRALGDCLSALRKHCVDDGRNALITCSSKQGDWTSGLVIAWLLWHCELVTQDSDSTLAYRLSHDRRETIPSINKEQVHSTMMHFLSTFPSCQLSRPTLKQLNRFFSSPAPSSTVS